MSEDLSLVNALRQRENLKLILPHLKKDVVSDDTLRIIKVFRDMFNLDKNLETIEWEDAITWAKVTNINNQKLIINALTTIQNKIDAGEVTPASTNALIKYYEDLRFAINLRNLSENFITGDITAFSELQEVVNKYQNSLINHSDSVKEYLIGHSLDDLIKETVGSSGYDWRLEELNMMLGPLRKGDLVIVAARPEVGKTTLIASEITYMAEQLPNDRPVLWVCNEEAGNRVKLRIYQAALGKKKDDIIKDTEKTNEELIELLGSLDKIQVAFSPYITVKQIEELCKTLNPGIIVIDQLDKVHGIKADRPDLMYKALYQWARVLANEYGPTIVVSQADAEAEGQRWLTQNRLDGSKTAKQGEADALIMIGKDDDPKYEYSRFISIAKNKLAGGPKSVESMRHGRVEVTINPEVARYES